MIIEVEEAIKVNGKHFHINDIIKVNLNTEEEGEDIIIGRISCISSDYLKIDYSEKYTASTTYVCFDTIKSIEKVEG